MSDTPPERLTAALADRYRIERTLGEGGMATVYLAEDLKHERQVAVKVLKPELAAVIGGERFVAEIKTTANLQHPGILPLFDSGQAEGFLYYVMPYVDGESLRDRLDREGQIGVTEALRITHDVAGALDYAHRNGVIHRDIKPENIMLQDGRPIVADFGIAVAISAAGGGRMTETGLSLGTPHYMSPEQATADRDLSAKSDVYSLACVLYEMLAGDPPHTGPNAQAVLMRILTEVPRTVTQVRTSTPPHVSAVLAKALEKLPADRFETAKEFAEALDNEGFTYRVRERTQVAAAESAQAVASGSGGPAWMRWVPWGIAAVAVLFAMWAGSGTSGTDSDMVMRLDLDLQGIVPGQQQDIAISPDGSMLATRGTRDGNGLIFVRGIDEADWRPLLEAENAGFPTFSPDSRYILFSGSDDTLVRVSVEGGSQFTMASVPGHRLYQSHWGKDGSIAASGPDGSFIFPGDGGDPIGPMPDGAWGRRPFMLPDGSGIVVSADGNVSVYDIESGTVTLLVTDAVHPWYLDSGHLLYLAPDGGLFAQPFDLDTHTLSGDPMRVLEQVSWGPGRRGYSISDNGTLVHLEGPSLSLFGAGDMARFVEWNTDGSLDTIPLAPANRQDPLYSPNGLSLVYEFYPEGGTTGDSQIHTLDLVTYNESILTFEEDNEDPIWSPDGTRVVFDREGPEDRDQEELHIKWVDNRAPAEKMLNLPGNQDAWQWLSDDRILFTSDEAGNWDIYTVSLQPDSEPEPFLQAPWDEETPQVSPDGTLIVYRSSESTDDRLWIRTFPDPTGQWLIPEEGIGWPRWAPNGSGVYYWKPGTPDTLKFAPIERDPVRILTPQTVVAFEQDGLRHWDIHPDGDRFLFRMDAFSGEGTPGWDEPRNLVVINWLKELRQRLEEGN